MNRIDKMTNKPANKQLISDQLPEEEIECDKDYKIQIQILKPPYEIQINRIILRNWDCHKDIEKYRYSILKR